MADGPSDEFALVEMSDLPQPTAPYHLMLAAQRNISLHTLVADRMDQLARDPVSPAVMMDLALALQLYGLRDEALTYQRNALTLATIYAQPSSGAGGIRLLCFMAPGDLAINMPIELMLHGRDVTLIKLYLIPGEPLPPRIPGHDAAIVAISEFDETRSILEKLAEMADKWPRPVVNDPRLILRLSRDRVSELLQNIPGLVVPTTTRLCLDDLSAICSEKLSASLSFPLLIRPVGTHAGRGLVCLDDSGALGAYVETAKARQFYVAPFVDYQSGDGLYRKFRVALIKGRPFLCHLAIAEDWMVHYGSSGMDCDQGKRDEERLAMETFDTLFVPRHRVALGMLAERLGLDIVVVDCAETQDGKLLFFEADNAGAIHDLDPPDVFPYKQGQMRRVFDAFHHMLRDFAAAGSSGEVGGDKAVEV